MSSTAATIVSAVIVSSPAWAGIFWNARSQRTRDRSQSRALAEQTHALKAHINAIAARGASTEPDEPKDEDADDRQRR